MRFGWLLLLLVGCATTPRSGEPEPPRSSVEALLRHAVELKLTKSQRGDLQAIDDKREGKAERLRVDLQQKYLDLTAGNNDNRSANRGSRAGITGYEVQGLKVRRALAKLDGEALRDAEALLGPDQVELGRGFVERARLERAATVQEDGE